MTIRRDGADQFTIENSTMTKDELLTRLRRNNVWTEEQLAKLTEMEVGDETNPPLAYYVKDGIPLESNNGVAGKPLTDAVKTRYGL